MPSDARDQPGPFDRFADAAAKYTSRAWFFAACVALVVIWAPSYFLIRDVNVWQLVINTATTCVTFLLVALWQNTQTRSDAAVQHKLNAIADALSTLVDDDQARELCEAVGLEEAESSRGNTGGGQ